MVTLIIIPYCLFTKLRIFTYFHFSDPKNMIYQYAVKMLHYKKKPDTRSGPICYINGYRKKEHHLLLLIFLHRQYHDVYDISRKS